MTPELEQKVDRWIEALKALKAGREVVVEYGMSGENLSDWLIRRIVTPKIKPILIEGYLNEYPNGSSRYLYETRDGAIANADNTCIRKAVYMREVEEE